MLGMEQRPGLGGTCFDDWRVGLLPHRLSILLHVEWQRGGCMVG